MLRSVNHIRTSHAGSLPPLGGAVVTHFSASIQRDAGAAAPQDPSSVKAQVLALINKQRDIGIHCVGDGEFWNGRGFLYYGEQFDGIRTRELRAVNAAREGKQYASAMSFQNCTTQWIVRAPYSASRVKFQSIILQK